MKFDKASTGNEGLDQAINYLRIGDNVVWQVDRLEDYMEYANAYVRNSLAENRNVIYMRFAVHEPIVKDNDAIKIYTLDPSIGFESFTIEVHRIIEKEGLEAFYVFDCLSNLLESWATDLMIGNFFQVTCPYLFQMETIAYFGIIRGNHSFETIARIRETTQLLLDLYNIEETRYIHPLKVWNRYSTTMFLPHIETKKELVPVTSSAESARLFSFLPQTGLGNSKRNLDYWDKLFMEAEEVLDKEPRDSNKEKAMVEQFCKLIIGKEKKVLDLAKRYFDLEDILAIKSRLIGSGFIGGKTVGMLLARQVLKKDTQSQWQDLLEEHDSFYIGSDVFYTYLVQNGWWHLRQKQRTQEGYFEAGAILEQNMKEGVFPETVKEQFMQMLEYYGQSPIIVRSSSLLEDSFGNAFAGKYESVFCVNQGSPLERYKQFEEAVRSVYVSSMNQHALEYRRKRGLDQRDEQMAILVQRVSGDYYKKYFFPFLAGVGFSYNSYVWNEQINPKEGMIRLVLGLGTKAVDRVEGDYPRVASLDQPMLQPIGNDEDMKKYSQHTVDVLNLVENAFQNVSLNQLMWEKPGLKMDLIGVLDHETNKRIKAYNIKEQEAWLLNYEKLFKETDFIPIMKNMLQQLEKAYTYPVDVEFTVNYIGEDRLKINLVQCRPLQTKGVIGEVEVPQDIDKESVVLSTKGHFMGGSIDQVIKRIIYIEPKAYSALSTQEKYGLSQFIGKLNQKIKDKESMPVMLVAPGRIGSSSPSLGLPINFSQISNMSILCETAYEIMGMVPDLSYGSHFFQDLVEADIFYIAVFPNHKHTIFNNNYFENATNELIDIIPEASKYEKVLKVIDTRNDFIIKGDLKAQNLIGYTSSR
ncbi:pyruvate phosphate dikinase-like enzyme [Natranaerovirga hydrolytica]|uniref:Pyruvate phosphate dikinase-like enzyme n=1 Tax=Natranaerovirga hydrolytica TaxID=680378 RepID=A0A4R1MKG7_9FIRM|nr:PEP/pyruvate-binding domain-containing protein [Natranaerovirga hydrolytica]TCK93216.1 pyruvate phosphate dikinase-like enzyme [Natranaerovirga hydrolytica]